MRVAVVADIHGNLTAFEAVLADLRQTRPDVVFHGGDLVGSGARSSEIVDWIRDLGWHGVLGNSDEMLSDPDTLEAFAKPLPYLRKLWDCLREMSAYDRAMLGDQRLAWIGRLPKVQFFADMALVHASPASAWKSPAVTASNGELEQVFGSLARTAAVYAHIHCPYFRNLSNTDGSRRIIVNTGGVSLSYDGDPRASYLLLDGSDPKIRRVEYDIERELKALSDCDLPHSDWVMKTLRTSTPQMP